MRTLEAGLARLEPQTAAHAAEMFAVLSDPAIYEFENEPPSSLAWLAARYVKLESRRSPDGQQLWLNWVIAMPTGQLAGYVQATVMPVEHAAFIAYELGSAFWGCGLATAAVHSMLSELAASYEVTQFWAIFKSANRRSQRLLERLGFAAATTGQRVAHPVEDDETLYSLLISDDRRLADASQQRDAGRQANRQHQKQK